MSGSFQTDGRIAELLAERAVEGLDQESQGVLAQLLSQEGLEDDDGFDRVAAALALNQLRPEPLPEPVRERIEQAESQIVERNRDLARLCEEAGARRVTRLG